MIAGLAGLAAFVAAAGTVERRSDLGDTPLYEFPSMLCGGIVAIALTASLRSDGGGSAIGLSVAWAGAAGSWACGWAWPSRHR